MKTIYISGKITGLSETEYRAKFKKGEDLWNSKEGWHSINPVKIGEELEFEVISNFGNVEDITWKDYMIVDIIELVKCDAIYMLEGWKESKGARLEHYLAQELELEIYYQ
jgi:hypothetical protein